MPVGLMEQPKRQKMLREPPADHKHSHASNHLNTTQGLGGRRGLMMKQFIPFNGLIDVRRVTSFGEEWLYNYPEFLSAEEIDLVQQINALVQGRTFNQLNSDVIGGIIAETLREYRDTGREFSLPPDTEVFLGRREKKQFEPDPFTHLDASSCISKHGAARTAENAKKRFIWLPSANKETALLCWMASPEAEKPALSLFFDRHSKCENHAWDDNNHGSQYLADRTTP